MGGRRAYTYPPHRRQVRDRARLAGGLLPARRRPLRHRGLQWRIASPPRLVLQPQGPPQDHRQGGYPDVHGMAEELGRARPADVAGRSVAWQVRYAAGVRPRKAASRSLGSAVAPAVTGAANRGGRPLRGTSTGAITSRPVARAGGMGWRCPHARDMSHPWTATSRAAVAAMTLAASGQPAISMTWRWWPGLVQASSSWQ